MNFTEVNGSNIIKNSTPIEVHNTVGVPITTGIGSVLSILGSFGIFWIVRKEERVTHTLWLLVFLTIADLLNAIGYLAGSVRYLVKYGGLITIEEATSVCSGSSDNLCELQSFLTTTATLSSFWWTFFLTLHHYLLCVTGTSFLTRKLFKYCLTHVFAWLLPITVATAAWICGVLGEGYSVSTGPWCWIKDCPDRYKDTVPPVAWMAITGKAWEMTTYLVTWVFYLLLKFDQYKRMHKQKNLRETVDIQSTSIESNNDTNDETKTFGILWLVLYLYVTRVWGTIRYLMAAYRFDNAKEFENLDISMFNTADKVLVYFQGIGDSLQAFVNFLVLFFSLRFDFETHCSFLYRSCKHDDEETTHLLSAD